MKGKSPLRLLLPVLALVLAVTAVPAGAASVEASSVRLVGDKTKLVTDPATTKVLLDNGIVPQAVGPTRSELLKRNRGVSVRYAFPITGGSVDLSALTGSIDHSGGLNFVNTNNGQSLLLTNFRIELGSAALTAEVNGDPAVRVAILDLDFSNARIIGQGRVVRVKNVGASLTETAAAALNASLGVGFFSVGIDLGTAQVFARVAA
jgi:hypothetical protein